MKLILRARALRVLECRSIVPQGVVQEGASVLGVRAGEAVRRNPELGAVRIRKLLDRYTQRDRYTAAICAAPSVLAAYGHLAGKNATSNPKFKEQVAIEGVRYHEDPVVTDGNIVTSRGPGTSIAFALALVETLAGRAKRDEVAAGLVLIQ